MIKELESLLEKMMKPGDLFSFTISNENDEVGMNCLVIEIYHEPVYDRVKVKFWTGSHEMTLDGKQIIRMLGEGMMKPVKDKEKT
jgi:hypothetical protein